MNTIRGIELCTGSREELLPGFARDFPYIATRAELDDYLVPWHWHKTVELFYVESGSLEYHTPGGRVVFGAGSGGMVNRDVLHMTKPLCRTQKNIQLLHIFDPSLLGGEPGSRIEQKYIVPLTASRIELIPLFPGSAVQDAILQRMLQAFALNSQEFGYEARLRAALTELWLMLLKLARPLPTGKEPPGRGGGEAVKAMLAFIHEHYPEKLSVRQLAAAACLSERACYRAFAGCLHTSPVEYLKAFRMQAACRMLAQGNAPITEIGQACGLGSSSYFGRLFRECMGCTPSQYRRKWQDRDT